MTHLNNAGYAVVDVDPNTIPSLQANHLLRIAITDDGLRTWRFVGSNLAGFKWVPHDKCYLWSGTVDEPSINSTNAAINLVEARADDGWVAVGVNGAQYSGNPDHVLINFLASFTKTDLGDVNTTITVYRDGVPIGAVSDNLISSSGLTEGHALEMSIVDDGPGKEPTYTFKSSIDAPYSGADQTTPNLSPVSLKACGDVGYLPDVFGFNILNDSVAGLSVSTTDTQGVQVDWGDGAIETTVDGVGLMHSYSPNYTGLVSLEEAVGSDMSTLRLYGAWNGDVGDIPKTVAEFRATNWGGGGNDNTFYGNISDVPELAQVFVMSGLNTIDGDVADTPAGFGNTYYTFSGQNTLYGDIQDIPVTSATGLVEINGQNTVGGLIHLIPSTFANTRLVIRGNTTVGGDMGLIDSAWSTSILQITGNNTMTGDIANLPPSAGTSYFVIEGSNTLYGDIATFSGAMANTIFTVRGSNTISGNIDGVPSTVANANFFLDGNNAVGGDIGLVAMTPNQLVVEGANTIGGNVDDINPNVGSQIFKIISSSCVIGGDLSGLDPSIGTSQFILEGNCTVTYSGGIPVGWEPASIFRYIPSTTGWSSAEVDQFLIDAASAGWSSMFLAVTGANAAPTAASSSAITTLTGNGVTVNTN